MDVRTKMLHIWFLKDKMEIERQRKQIIMKNLPTIFIESISYLCVSFHARLSYLTFSTGIDFRTLKLNRFWIKWMTNITYINYKTDLNKRMKKYSKIETRILQILIILCIHVKHKFAYWVNVLKFSYVSIKFGDSFVFQEKNAHLNLGCTKK